MHEFLNFKISVLRTEQYRMTKMNKKKEIQTGTYVIMFVIREIKII